MAVWEHNTKTIYDREIHLFDGQNVIPLTDNVRKDEYPQISGTNVVGRYLGEDAAQVMLYDGATTTPLTGTESEAGAPQISGSRVVWHDGTGQIFLYDGVTTVPVGSNPGNDPVVSDTHVAWQGTDGGAEVEIFLYDGATVTQLTHDVDVFDMNPKISGGRVVWHTEEWVDDPAGGHLEMDAFFYDGSQVVQLSDNGLHQAGNAVSEEYVAWDELREPDSTDIKVLLFDGQDTVELTGGGGHDANPKADGSLVVWQGTTGIGGHALFVYDGTSVIRLTDPDAGAVGDFDIDGTTIVWSAKMNGEDDYDIFMAQPVPEPVTMGLLAVGAMGLLRRRRR